MKAVILSIVILVIIATTTVGAVEVKSTIRLDYTGSFSVWYMPSFDFDSSITPSAAIIACEGVCELYAFAGIKLPASLSLDIGPAITVNTDDQVGHVDKALACMIVCGRWERVSLDSLNMWGMPRTNDPDYYWGRQQLKFKIFKDIGLFIGGQIEGCVYSDDSPKSLTTGPNTGLNFGEKGCLELYYGFNLNKDTDRKVRIRYTAGL